MTWSGAYPEAWRRAVERAAPLPGRVLVGVDATTTGSWDALAVRRIAAVVVYALAVRDAGEPTWGEVGYHLADEEQVRALAEALGLPEYGDHSVVDVLDDGHEDDGEGVGGFGSADEDDAALGPYAVWWWLTRPWPTDLDEPPQWAGLSRGIARGVSDPAVSVCVQWAHDAVVAALADEHGALPKHTEVLVDVTGDTGPVQGSTVAGSAAAGRTVAGLVVGPAWTADHERQTYAPPGAAWPPAYEIACADGRTRIIRADRVRAVNA